MVIQDPCGICHKPVASNHRSAKCNFCKFWIHIKCNNISPQEYDIMREEGDDKPWMCIKCFNETLPFGQIDNKSFLLTQKCITAEHNLEDLNFTMTAQDKRFVKQISNLIIQNTDPDNDNSNFCKYYNLDKFSRSKFKPEQSLSIMHLNIASLQYHIDDLKILIQSLDFKFDILAISESKLKQFTIPTRDINIPNYQYVHTSTKASKGGTLIYISNKFIYKPRRDLEIYQPKQIESTFTEIVMPKGKNIIVGCIYRHHTIDIGLQPLLVKLNNENIINLHYW